MQNRLLPRPQRGRPLYQQVHDQLAERLAGHHDPHQKLPSEEELAREYGVSQGTVRKALTMLKDECVVVRRHRVRHTSQRSHFPRPRLPL